MAQPCRCGKHGASGRFQPQRGVGKRRVRAFSGKVDTGFPSENASTDKSWSIFRLEQSEIALAVGLGVLAGRRVEQPGNELHAAFIAGLPRHTALARDATI